MVFDDMVFVSAGESFVKPTCEPVVKSSENVSKSFQYSDSFVSVSELLANVGDRNFIHPYMLCSLKFLGEFSYV